MYPDLSCVMPVMCWNKLPSGGDTLINANFAVSSWAPAIRNDDRNKKKKISFFRMDDFLLI